jgi:digeranylgeranylglycerophospholipid reductase
MTERRQLLIIGGGPAGGCAALNAARGGLDTLLIERDREIGRPLLCAEGISRDGLKKFIEPDAAFISSEINSIGFTVATGFDFVYQMDQYLGFVLDRPSFDRYLAEKAKECGAEIRTGVYAAGISWREDGPVEVSVKTDEGEKILEADYVIAADGVESMIGRMAGIKTGLKLAETDACLQYRVSGITLDPHRLEFFVGKKYSTDSYLWVFPKSEHSANIGLGHDPGRNDNRDLRRHLDQFLRGRYANYTVDFEICGMVPKFLGFDILGRGRLLLAGDAARTIDSLTGAGICRALHTGKLAAEAVVKTVNGEIPSKELVAVYTEAVDGEIGRDLRFLKKAQLIFRKFTDEDWESLARFLEKYLSKQKAGSVDPAEIVKSALTAAPRLVRLARHLF